jgi:acyl-CoA thioesterase-1
MNDVVVGSKFCRRAWLVHCTALAFAALAAGPALAQPAAPGPSKILVVGDSLSAEYGLPRGSGWVSLLEQRIRQNKIPATVVNASISGDTTSGGRSRLPALLQQQHPTHVVLELGANDALRGLPLAMTQANLTEMARQAKDSGARVVIVGMQVPPNYGRKYSDDFAALFASVAKQQGAALVPFLLKGVADVPDAQRLFQSDRIHPLATAHPTLLANVWPVLKPLLAR